MYARQLSMKSTPANRSQIEALADDVFGRVQSMDGFISIHFLITPDETTYGAVSFWESKDAAESAGEQLRTYTRERIEKLVLEAPVETYYEVYKPKK